MIDVLLVRELARSGRSRWVHYSRWGYAAWLVLVLYLQHAKYYADYLVRSPAGTFPAAATTDFAHRLVDFLVFQQTMVVLLAGPTFAAGAVTDEKVRGTLELLFLAHLTPGSIILGKLLARVAQGFLWSLAAWPVIAFAGFPGGVTPVFFGALAWITLLMLMGTCAVSLLASVWSRNTRDAVVVVYTVIAVMIGIVVLAQSAGPRWRPLAAFDPNFVLDTARDAPDYAELGQRLGLATMMWGGVTIASTAIAAWRLRPAYIKQMVKRRSRFLQAISMRPPMSNRPLQWKEQYSTRVPRWLGMVITGSLAVAATIAELVTLPSLSMVEQTMLNSHWLLVFLVSLAAGIRASGAVITERDRQTWDCLVCTPYDFRRIVGDKISGICLSVWPYYFAALIPSLAVVSLAGIDQVLAAMPTPNAVKAQGLWSLMGTYGPMVGWVVLGPGLILVSLIGLVFLFHLGIKLAWYPYCAAVVAMIAAANAGWLFVFVPLGVAIAGVAMHFIAGVGLWISAKATNAWISLLATVIVGYLAAVVVLGFSCPFGCLTGCIGSMLTSSMNDLLGTGNFGLDNALVWVFFACGGLLGLWWTGQLFAQWSVQYLEKTDRVPGNYIREIELDQPYAEKED